jgi:hypothetical protein
MRINKLPGELAAKGRELAAALARTNHIFVAILVTIVVLAILYLAVEHAQKWPVERNGKASKK